jgi:hypothetical protein
MAGGVQQRGLHETYLVDRLTMCCYLNRTVRAGSRVAHVSETPYPR